jgi:hypothetical protein
MFIIIVIIIINKTIRVCDLVAGVVGEEEVLGLVGDGVLVVVEGDALLVHLLQLRAHLEEDDPRMGGQWRY